MVSIPPTAPRVFDGRAFFPYVVLYTTLYGGFGIMSPFLPTLLQARGLQAQEIGVVLAASILIRLVSGPLAGRVADLLSALRAVLAACALVAALCGLGFLPARSFWLLLTVSVAYAAALAPLTTIADALSLRAAGPSKGPGWRFEYGWVRGAGSAAFIVGSLLAGEAIAATGYNAIIWGSSALLVAVACAAPFVLASRPASTRAEAGAGASLHRLLRLRSFWLLLVIAALVLGSHAMHDAFAMIRWKAAGISPLTASVLWSESVASEVLVFVLAGPPLLDRFGPAIAMAISAFAATLRWSVMALTANVVAMAFSEPLHGLSFALLHLACMRLIAKLVPAGLAATAQAIYGTLAVGAATALVTLASGTLYGRFGAGGFWVMAGCAASSLPFIAALRRSTAESTTGDQLGRSGIS